MNKIIPLLMIVFLLFLNTLGFSQEFHGTMHYKEIARYARYRVFESVLEFYSKEGLYVIKPLDSQVNNHVDNNGVTKKINYQSNNRNKDCFYTKRNDTLVKTHDNFLDESICFMDHATQDWRLTNESKIIMNLSCHKAITEFRGRKYVAWYTPDIPVGYGPRNFYGLPG